MTEIFIKDPNKAASAFEQYKKELAFDRVAAGAAAQRNKTITPEDAGIDLSRITWPSERKPEELAQYDYYHGKYTSQLAVHILEGFPDVRPRELQVLRTAAFLHDLGRERNWRMADPGHQERSARMANEVLRASPLWSNSDLVDEMCALIAKHTLPGRPVSPSEIVLHDAECFESARFAPDTREGIEIMRARMGACVTPWGQLLEHQRRWRATRGWKGA